ncbi:uncharacterized protein N0V89_010081 [Didymosphaeria variabile]|uniref:Uncharacterized protein n=1 Tax=Didymosphaeria variabile TaxID=1932322 RepID=A0A9W9C7W3_9PLEO|nr:uncharacterized protein N0V89_010081 [Didymosphaeria variabile]KAJ4348703.1 hypothetical protein N0V89_010081 [Didymosphaeria variabile]
MTTYFYRNPDGSEYIRVLPNVAPVYFATALVPGSALESHWQRMGAQPTFPNNMIDHGPDDYSIALDDEWHETDDGYYSDSAEKPLGGGYFDSPTSGGSPFGMMSLGLPLMPQYGGDMLEYPNLELIRDHHSLRSLLPYIQPARFQNSLFGPTLDIVEEGTDHKFAAAVPKKMLALFCGRKMLNRFLRTLEREDNEKWVGGPVGQELRFPRHHVNHIGVKIVIAWMHRACRTPKEEMKQIRIPKNLFAALSLARALTAFGLHSDANRVDMFIANHHYQRPMYPNEIFSIWNCLPKDSKYIYRMIADLRKKRCEYESGNTNALKDAEKVLAFLEEHPELKARLDDKDYNDREEHRPFFGTEWCQRAALQTQQMLAGSENMKDGETLMSGEWHGKSARPQLRGKTRRSGRPRNDQDKGRPQPRKPMTSLKNHEPKIAPAAWPQFEKVVVLKIVDAHEKAPGDADEATDSTYGSEDKPPR